LKSKNLFLRILKLILNKINFMLKKIALLIIFLLNISTAKSEDYFVPTKEDGSISDLESQHQITKKQAQERFEKRSLDLQRKPKIKL
jgi:hypothetical protein